MLSEHLHPVTRVLEQCELNSWTKGYVISPRLFVEHKLENHFNL